jgi:hypothetical protein
MEWLFPLLGGLGIGSLLSAIVNHHLAVRSKLKDRLYEEKRETYLGMIQALRDCCVRPSLETVKTYGAWHDRCKLFGSEDVVRASQQYIETSNDIGGEARAKAYKELFEEMRSDIRR